jgi:glutamyl-tRNA synthetase
LFNWLYVRRHGGTFVLRIEDTDAERSSADMVTGILSSLRWLGLDWDEGPEVGGAYGPYFQSQRLDRHREVAASLVASGHAYYCYCRQDDQKAKRDAAEAAGGAWMYDRTCFSLRPDEIAAHEAAGHPRVVRVRVPPGETAFADLVHGTITVAHSAIEDFVILRSDGSPTYQLSVVADDVDMGMTHVVRGDDHISNTPKQILLYRAMGAPVPSFAHVPLILGPDKKRLSKRHGATAVGEYEAQGYLPEAMVNFLALLGWSPGSGDQEVFACDELVDRFTLDGISGGNAVFNPDKLNWFNQQHIARLGPDDILERIRPDLERSGLWHDDFTGSRRLWMNRVIDLLKPRAHKLGDFVTQLRPFVVDRVDRDPAAVAKHLADPGIGHHLAAWRDVLRTLAPFDAPTLEAALRELADQRRIKAGVLIHATRVAVVGQAASPGLFDVLELVGREHVVARLTEAMASRPDGAR